MVPDETIRDAMPASAIRTIAKHRARWFRIAALAPLGVTSAVLLAVTLAGVPTSGVRWLLTLAWYLVAWAPLGLLASAVAPSVATTRAGEIAFDGTTLRVRRNERTRTIPRADIVDGWVEQRKPNDRLHLTLKNGDAMTLDTPHASDLLRAIGLDVRRRAARFATRGAIGPFVRGLVASTFVGIATACVAFGDLHGREPSSLVTFPLWWFVALLTGVLVGHWFGPPRLVVGSDGVALEGALSTTFISYDAIASVRVDAQAYQPNGIPMPGHLRLTLHDGSTRSIPVIGTPATTLHAMAARIQDALAARDTSVSDPNVRQRLRRAGRSPKEWMHALVRMVEGGEAYRGVALTTDDVARVLTDPAASAEQRAGAALVLGRDADGRSRVRVAIDASASPALRKALDAAAHGAPNMRALERAALKKQS